MEKEGEFKSTKEVEEIAKEPEPKDIDEYAKISDDNKSLLVRIPAKIRDTFHIEKGNYIHFFAKIKEGKIGKLIIKFVKK